MSKERDLRLFDPSPTNVVLAVVAALGYVFSAIACLYLGEVVDGLVGGADAGSMAGLLGAFLALSLASALAQLFLTSWLPQRRNLESEMRSSLDALDWMLDTPSRLLRAHDDGHYLNLVTTASFAFGGLRVVLSVELVGAILSLVVLLCVAASVSLALVPLFVGYLVVALLVIELPARRASEAQDTRLSERERWLGEVSRLIDNKRVINASAAEGYFEGRFSRSSDRYYSADARYRFWDCLSTSLPPALFGAMQALTAIAGVLLCVAGQLSVGGVMSAYLMTVMFREPVNTIAAVRGAYRSQAPNVTAFRELAAESDAPTGYEAAWTRDAPVVARLGAGELRASQDGPALFSTDGLSVRRGALVVLRGENGSGKSTLVELLCGCSDPALFSGSVELSPELADASVLARPVPVVSGTLEDNLFGVPLDDETERLLDLSSLEGRLLDGGPQCVSLGERQKIGLARALARRSSVLVLDEPLANLDRATAERLCAWLAGGRDGRTTFVVMHSDELDGAADCLMTIKDGRLCVDDRTRGE